MKMSIIRGMDQVLLVSDQSINPMTACSEAFCPFGCLAVMSQCHLCNWSRLHLKIVIKQNNQDIIFKVKFLTGVVVDQKVLIAEILTILFIIFTWFSNSTEPGCYGKEMCGCESCVAIFSNLLCERQFLAIVTLVDDRDGSPERGQKVSHGHLSASIENEKICDAPSLCRSIVCYKTF